MSGKNKAIIGITLFSFSLTLFISPAQGADKKKQDLPLGISNGECVSAKYAIGPADEDLKSDQIDFGCSMALLQDYGDGISLSQFGYMGEDAPGAGFVTKIDPSKSTASRSYANVTDFIVKQKRIPAEAGWCVAEMRMPKEPADKERPKLKIPEWVISCIAWGTTAPAKGEKTAEKMIAIVNFKGSVPLPLPDAPKPSAVTP
ncbi:hypothetical protein FAI40_07865 [Acetobacteraceae bacterium]|nr:hypothetical protein FAI40_07865 [Acetobacteraceae bacterium]